MFAHKNKNIIKSVSIINTCDCAMRAAGYLPLLTRVLVYRLRHTGIWRALESRTHAVKLLEDLRRSFLAQRRVCEDGDVSAF